MSNPETTPEPTAEFTPSDLLWAREFGKREAVKPVELIATTSHPIVSMVVFKDRLFVATGEAVFERGEDGVFRECQFQPIGEAK